MFRCPVMGVMASVDITFRCLVLGVMAGVDIDVSLSFAGRYGECRY